MIDSSAGGGVTLPQNTDAWNYGTPGTPLWGLEAPMPVRLISLGPCDIAVNAFTGDAAPPIAILKAFTAVDYIPGGSGGTWACIRVW
jgi:hypothetical protein